MQQLTLITSGPCAHVKVTVFVQNLSTQTQKNIHTHTHSKNANIVKFETAHSLHGETKSDHSLCCPMIINEHEVNFGAVTNMKPHYNFKREYTFTYAS